MFASDSIFELLVASVFLLYAGGLWCFFAVWKRYRFSLWWLCAVVVLLLAPVFLFPLCGCLRYSAVKRLNLPQEESERAVFYNRLGWASALCFLLVGIVVQAVLDYVLPSVEYTLGLSFALTTFAWAIVSATYLCLLRRRRIYR